MMPMKNSGKNRIEYRERNLRILLEYIHYGTYKKVGELEGVTGERIRQIKEWTLFHLFGHSRESSPRKLCAVWHNGKVYPKARCGKP